MPKKKKDEVPKLEDLISLTEAARLRGVTLAAIQDLIRRDRLQAVEVGGRRFLNRSDVMAFRQAHKGGRGRKAGN
jgi:excisionase family DNA binding protein